MENPDGEAMVSLSEIKNAGGETSFKRKRRNLTFKMIILKYICLNKGKVLCYLKFTT